MQIFIHSIMGDAGKRKAGIWLPRAGANAMLLNRKYNIVMIHCVTACAKVQLGYASASRAAVPS